MSKEKERFFKFVRKDKLGCWLWTGFLYRNGYGEFYLKGKQLAHRAAYSLFCGLIPEGMFVCHTCDVRNCVNPDHLWLGTVKDNQQDMSLKGRAACGDRNGSRIYKERMPRGDKHPSKLHPELVKKGEELPQAKLTANEVMLIRKCWEDGMTQKAISGKFGVVQPLISLIVNHKIWRHVA